MNSLTKIFIALSFMILIVSCNKKDQDDDMETIILVCNVENPTEEILWLKEMITAFDLSASATQKKISLYQYNGNDVFLVEGCVGCVDGYSWLLNCTNEMICEFGSIAGLDTCPDFGENATFVEVLYPN